jgi:hypothetical protein
MHSVGLLMIALVLALQNPPAAVQPPPQKPPDCSAPVHRQFDFWIGEWDVVPNGRPPQPGQKPGVNVITSEYGGCLIVERYEQPPFSGSSYNIYDRSRGEWHQTWVDVTGGLHQYWGGLKDGNMVFHGEVPLPPAAKYGGYRRVRMTFFPMGPDKVRQFSESYMPDGTWTVNYDLIYTRRKSRVEGR